MSQDGDSQTLTVERIDKDGTVVAKGTDGKEIRLVKESDLLAVKGGAAAVEKRLKEIEETHKTELDSANAKVSDTSNRLLVAEAAKEKLEEQLKQSATSAEDVAGIKKKLEEADKTVAALSQKVLESRRQLIITTFSIPAETVANKTLEQLDAYEEALKAVASARKVGPYALAGGGGGGAPESPMDRAKRIIAEAEAKGRKG